MIKSSPEFREQCYDLLLKIPHGKVTTYKEIAKALGSKAWRTVGSVIALNPNLINVPCHRVIKSNGQIGNYVLGTDRKAELLTKEGIPLAKGKVVNFEQYFHRF
ncbi:MGMT family protein [Crocosphaera chwakensis]|uniref:Methyltransferase n=1 Tax=Crocosphaera chwakensis CCY0110 TaxID=391612 RepID=A3IVK5_9CHRO|nr:MGMT family protein [Crocosphaera chwakensis]EAZ89480.1 methyltransferase [Crocosphaera chwakensis CCY0110]